MRRTPQNCTIADKVYDRDDKLRYLCGMCAGVRDKNDNLIPECEKCKLCWYYEEEWYDYS